MKKQHNKLPIVWSLHLPQDKRQDFNNHVSMTLEDRAFKRLLDILIEKQEACLYEHNYDHVNWAYYQAHKNGYVEALQDIMTLITKKDI